MDWAAIIQLAIMVLTMILEYLGGGTFTRVITPDSATQHHLASYQWSCSQPNWGSSGMNNGAFSGAVSMKCKVEGVNGGGISNLREYLASQVSTVSADDKITVSVENFEGMPAQVFAHNLLLEDTLQNRYEVSGSTHLATNGFNTLRSVFRASSLPKFGGLPYLKSLEDEMLVDTSVEAGWYEVTLKSSVTLVKPWWVSNELFVSAVKQKLSESLENRKEKILNDVASQL